MDQLYQQYLDCGQQICTDTRKIEPGCIFFALKGANFNGNTFAAKALEQGARLAIIDEPKFQTDQEKMVVVKDVLTTLQDLALYHRKQVNPKVLALTGSNGKTTTKELMAQVLASTYQIHFTQGNFNNHIGVPLTLLAMPSNTQIAIIEMGANHVGEIAALSKMADPEWGLITNIGKAHLEGFGGIKGVIKGKGELFQYLQSNNGFAFVNASYPSLVEKAKGIAQQVTYSSNPTIKADIMGEVTGLVGGVKIQITSPSPPFEVQSQLTGSYNADNILAAIAIGLHFNVPISAMQASIQAYQPKNQRSQLVHSEGITFIVDCYNANPSSMYAAIENLIAMEGQPKAVILGDMLELGEASRIEHQKILALLQQHPAIQVALIGPEFEKAVADNNTAFSVFDGWEAAQNWLEQFKKNKSGLLLIKGSRGLALEKLVVKELALID